MKITRCWVIQYEAGECSGTSMYPDKAEEPVVVRSLGRRGLEATSAGHRRRVEVVVVLMEVDGSEDWERE